MVLSLPTQTLVYQIDIGITRLLWVGKERTIESCSGSAGNGESVRPLR